MASGKVSNLQKGLQEVDNRSTRSSASRAAECAVSSSPAAGANPAVPAPRRSVAASQEEGRLEDVPSSSPS